MNYEEKYKDLVKAVKELQEANPSDEGIQNWVNENVPEIKESEDDKIRKTLINFFDGWGDKIWDNGIKFAEVVAWLEKQSAPQVRTGLEWGNTIDDACDKRYLEEYADGEYCHEQSFKWGFQEGVEWLERQGKQKPADKVEPKFKVGDWITDGKALLYVIKFEVDYGYELKAIDGKVFHFVSPDLVEEYYRLWTIQDAKDGDVLHSTGFHNDCIFIFNGLDNWRFDEPNGDRAVATGYCCLFVSADNMEFSMQGPDCIEVNTVKPATKIQHDLLFQKMKEAGYEWNAEKKELKRIEQTPAWSEEDERIINSIIHDIRTSQHYDTHSIGEYDKKVFWLKSLRPQNTWKPSDEQMERLKGTINSLPHQEVLYSLYQDLKKLKE